MLVSEFEGMEKYLKQEAKSEQEEQEEGGEEEMEEDIMQKEEIPIKPKQDGVHLKYVITNDRINHPVFEAEPISLDPSRVNGSDAYIIRTNKRDVKGQLKMVQQIK